MPENETNPVAAKPAAKKPAASKASAKAGTKAAPKPKAKTATAKSPPAKTAAKTGKPAPAKKPSTTKASATKTTSRSAGSNRTAIVATRMQPSKTSPDTGASDAIGTKAMDLAADWKMRASEALKNLGRLLGDSAEVIDGNLGQRYGDYARNASQSVRDSADRLRAKPVEDIADDAKEFVKKSPGVAIGIAAVASLVMAKVISSAFSKRN